MTARLLAESGLPAPYYADDAVTLYHGDCRELLPLITSATHAITDPPYEAEAHTKARRVKRGGVAVLEPLSFDPMTDDLRTFVGAELQRITERWALVFCQVEATQMWRASMAGLAYRRTCIWHKPDGQPQLTGDRPGVGYEAIVAMHRKGRSRWNGGGRCGVFSFCKNEPALGRTQGPHQTIKPLALMRELVRLFTDPGDVILDPFAGSGTTGLAARVESRRAILIERDERYAETAAERLSALPVADRGGTLPLFGSVG